MTAEAMRVGAKEAFWLFQSFRRSIQRCRVIRFPVSESLLCPSPKLTKSRRGRADLSGEEQDLRDVRTREQPSRRRAECGVVQGEAGEPVTHDRSRTRSLFFAAVCWTGWMDRGPAGRRGRLGRAAGTVSRRVQNDGPQEASRPPEGLLTTIKTTGQGPSEAQVRLRAHDTEHHFATARIVASNPQPATMLVTAPGR